MTTETRQTVAVHPEPTGASHEVAATEMFFSTTDSRGVITDANSVFVRLSRYPLQSLLNAPHSIIRHPGMPGGAFEAMWQTLNAGDPFCAYVDNLAADGSRYTVFATVTPPADEGYLSVRTRPLCLDLLDTVRGMYAVTRPQERLARDGGASAHEAATLGAVRTACRAARHERGRRRPRCHPSRGGRHARGRRSKRCAVRYSRGGGSSGTVTPRR